MCNVLSSLLSFLPPANEVCECYVFTPVCQSFCSWGGACVAGVCMTGGVHGRGHTWQEGGAWQGGACMPCHYEILRDTVNERAVGILLECILVFYSLTYDSRPYVLSLTSFTMLCYIYYGSYGL